MAKKLPTAYKVKILERYGADVALYQLSKSLGKGKDKADFLIVSIPKVVSGRPDITMWSADEIGAITENVPVHVSKSKTIKDAFLEVGYQV